MNIGKKVDDNKVADEKVAENESAAEKESTDVVSSGNTNNVIKNHMISTMGVGLLPLPLLDMVAISTVQLNMIKNLAKSYGVPFNWSKARSLSTSLVGGALPVTGTMGVASIIKSIPILGTNAGGISMSLLGASSTYAVGKVFDRHFAQGGTLDDFKVSAFKTLFEKEFEQGKKVAADTAKTMTPEED